MRLGTSAASVAQWQSFLRRKRLYTGPVDGVFGPDTAWATRAFQRKAGIEADGVVGPETIARAMQEGMAAPRDVFEIGPDRPDVLIEARPYFLVPLDVPELAERVRQRIVAWTARGSRTITDIYVITHGWHRNFLAAVAAYDRIAARLVLLRRRGRIRPSKGYAPLFLSIHWHSDPGEDGWVDPAGRRRKASFLDHARAAFVPKQSRRRRFIQDFEDIYELFARMCAPDVPALGSWNTRSLGPRLDKVLDRYRLRDGEDGTPAEKSAVAWMCWHEAQAEGILTDQHTAPTPILGPIAAILNLLQFGLSAAGILASACLVVAAFWHPVTGWMRSALHAAGAASWWGVGAAWLAIQMLAWACFRIGGATEGDPFEAEGISPPIPRLWGNGDHRTGRGGTEQSAGSLGRAAAAEAPFTPASGAVDVSIGDTSATPAISLCGPALAGFLWVTLQIPRLALLLLACTAFYLLGGLSGSRLGLFDERIGLRNRRPEACCAPRRTLLERLACWTARPAAWLIRSSRADRSLSALASAIIKQLAFWTMQRTAVETGRRTADFLARLGAACDRVQGARIHLIGHSFGALAAANAARHLALEHQRNIHSLCLLSPAMAADWFDAELSMLGRLKGALGCIFSRYDTANSFYYPFANRARTSAGTSGIVAAAPRKRRARFGFGQHGNPSDGNLQHCVASFPVRRLAVGGLFASLAHPPNLLPAFTSHGDPGDPPWLLNLDASRVMYEGHPAAGGSHDDVFKDDVVNLIWSVTQMSQCAGGGTLDPRPAGGLPGRGPTRSDGANQPLPGEAATGGGSDPSISSGESISSMVAALPRSDVENCAGTGPSRGFRHNGIRGTTCHDSP
ncbi:MAG: peptidoglycan-binding protein [Chthonomonadales bacterium]